MPAPDVDVVERRCSPRLTGQRSAAPRKIKGPTRSTLAIALTLGGLSLGITLLGSLTLLGTSPVTGMPTRWALLWRMSRAKTGHRLRRSGWRFLIAKH